MSCRLPFPPSGENEQPDGIEHAGTVLSWSVTQGGPMRRFSFAVAAVAALACSAVLFAQQTSTIHPGKGGSPHVRSSWTIHGAKISIEYGRPYLKGRAEATLMPPGKPWRTGADEATVLTTDKALKIGPLTLAPGTYT